MSSHNVRRPVTESYDPKQRIVGGIVLSLLMLFIYSILKLVLGFSSVPAGEYILSEPLMDEVPTIVAGTNNTTTSNRTQPSRRINYRLPQRFVFLDLKGNPMQPEASNSNSQSEFMSPSEIYNSIDNRGKWYVQAASFRKPERAQSLVEKIKNKNVAASVHIIETTNGWYLVRLPPQDNENMAQQQNRKLRNLLRLRGIVKEIK